MMFFNRRPAAASLLGKIGELLGRSPVRRSMWSLIDQAVVSAGAFVGNVLMARELAPSDYGVFALLFGATLGLQLVNATLLYHPLSIRLVPRPEAERKWLLANSLVLIGILSIGLCVLLALGLWAFGYSFLIIPAFIWFLFWQLQEGLRRSLLSLFRHKDAIWGDAVSYIGQAAVIMGLLVYEQLTLSNAIWGMAITSAAAGVIQWLQLQPLKLDRLALGEIAKDYWSVGGLMALGSGLLTYGRLQVVPWVLAFFSGPAAAAGFQAAVNVINLLNPISISVGNVVPQAVSEIQSKGRVAAWRTALSYGALAAPPILGWGVIVGLVPGVVLMVLYGGDSTYVDQAWPLRLLMLGAVLMYAGDITIMFLHGIAAVRAAFLINAAAVVATVLLTVPLVAAFGIVGGCIALLGGNLVRLIVIHIIMKPILGEAPFDSVASLAHRERVRLSHWMNLGRKQ